MNADDIARAICAAAKETGADPIDLALGNDRTAGYPQASMLKVSRARAYAGRALVKVFDNVARPTIARLIGVSRPSQGSFFSSLDGRPTPWWFEDVFGRVVSAVEAGRVRPEPETAPAAARSPEPAPQPEWVISPGQRFRGYGRQPIGTLERDGFRPAPGTAEAVLRDDKDHYVSVGPPIKQDDFLRRAVENTAKMTPPPED